MAQDMFLKIDGIPGESLDSKHQGEIDILSYSFGATQAGTMAFGGGGGAGRVSLQDFHFVVTVNKATPKLFLACATGEYIKSAVLTCRKAGKEQQEYLKIKLGDVLVSSYQINGDGNTSPLPVDSISLNFRRIEWLYMVQNEKGQLVPGALVDYDVANPHWIGF
jgi:type VI secretion system secreted protein Hcp